MKQRKQPVQIGEEGVARSVFWGTLVLDGIALLVFGYFLSFMLKPDKTPVIYAGIVIFLFAFIAALTSLVLTIRGRQRLGAEIVLYTLSVLGMTITTLFQGRTQTASLSIFTLSIITILYLLPKQSRRRYLSVAVVSMIVMWTIEWIDPSWRIQIDAAKVGPGAVVVFAVTLFVLVSRQVWGASLRNKLMVAFISVTAITTGALGIFMYFTTSNNLRENLERELSAHALSRATRIGDLFNEQINALTTLSINDSLLRAVEEQNNSYQGSSAAAIQAELDEKDAQWRAADAADNDNDSLVRERLSNAVAREVTKYKLAFPDHVEVFITDVYGGLAGSTNRTSDYYQADEGWWQAAYNGGQGGVYISEPEFDESAGAIGMQIALPLRDSESGEITGILRTTYILSPLTSILTESIGQTGEADLYIPGEVVSVIHGGNFEQVEAEEFEALKAVARQGMVEMDHNGEPSVVSQAKVQTLGGNPYVDTLGWVVVIHQARDEAFAPLNAQVQGLVIVMGLVVTLVLAAAYALSQFLIRPINQLTATAEEVSAGNLGSRAKVTTSDEVGALASAFNSMTSRLRETLENLEQRVAERTRNLELAAEVGRAVSHVRDLDDLLRDACDLILKEFGLYYVQVYLTNPSQTTLVLEAGTGDVGAQLIGRGHSLQFDTGSINGRAAVEKRSVVISDTAQSTTFRRNSLLPKTRSEMAVPLIVADRVVGVLDMQSSEPGGLTQEVLPAFEALAGQLAVAVQNANLLAETERARAQVEAQARRLVREGWSGHLDAIHKPEQLGFVFDRKNVMPLAEVTEDQLPGDGKSVTAPIRVSGESLGSMVVELEDETRLEQTSELVNVVARQVAQQIENLRLLESAERYRYEAERTARLQTLEGWQKYFASRTADKLGYLYDANEVRPQNQAGGEEVPMFALPLKARDETIGRLSVQGLTHEDQESVNLVSAISERLGAHIENLRLFEETRLGQMELDKRARQLAAVAEISTASSQELELDTMLRTVVHLTQRQFNLYHVHAFTLNEWAQELQIAACGWREGDENEGTHESVSIPLDKEQSLVARAARTGQSVIVNDVKSEPGWLANPLLPDTASEMAIPLVVGNQVLGVLDVQSDRLNAFTEEDANIQTTLASQVATGMQNARSFTRAQKQAEREAMLNVINQKIQSATSVEAVLQIAARELGHALGAPMTVAQLSMKNKS